MKRIVAIAAGALAFAGLLPSGALAAAPKKPTVVTKAATGIGRDVATLNGAVNPNGQNTVYHFDYGSSTSYGLRTGDAPAGAGVTSVAAAAGLTGLAPGTTYHYRLVAASPKGATNGRDRTFTTVRDLLISSTPRVIDFGSSTTIGGQLLGAGNAGRSVVLSGGPSPLGPFSTIGTAPTDATGHYGFPPVAPGSSTYYRTQVGTKAPTFSAVIIVKVRARIGLGLSDTTPNRGQRVKFSGHICPVEPGVLVSLQKLTRHGFRTFAHVHTHASTAAPGCATRSGYDRVLRVYHSGTIRAVVPKVGGLYPAEARRVHVRVH